MRGQGGGMVDQPVPPTAPDLLRPMKPRSSSATSTSCCHGQVNLKGLLLPLFLNSVDTLPPLSQSLPDRLQDPVESPLHRAPVQPPHPLTNLLERLVLHEMGPKDRGIM